MDIVRQHEISEADNRILNPFDEAKLMLLGEVCRLQTGQQLLDLACGKGEMLCRWAARFGIEGLGVDISEVFVAAARKRAEELGVADRVRFASGDAGRFKADVASFDIVSCVGATWIGGGISGTVDLMRPALRPGGLLLIGEPYWTEPPSKEVLTAIGCEPDAFTSLVGTLDRFEAARTRLVEMVLADSDTWDRYVASQWWTVSRWLEAHREDPEAPAMREFLEKSRRAHLEYGRRYLGWGVFVLLAA